MQNHLHKGTGEPQAAAKCAAIEIQGVYDRVLTAKVTAHNLVGKYKTVFSYYDTSKCRMGKIDKSEYQIKQTMSKSNKNVEFRQKEEKNLLTENALHIEFFCI